MTWAFEGYDNTKAARLQQHFCQKLLALQSDQTVTNCCQGLDLSNSNKVSPTDISLGLLMPQRFSRACAHPHSTAS
jgi:hypothetical protein